MPVEPYVPLLLAAAVGLAVLGALAGWRGWRSETRLPEDLALTLEVGATRTTVRGAALDRIGLRCAPLVLRLMGAAGVAAKRQQLDRVGNPGGLTVQRYAARRAAYGMFGLVMALIGLAAGSVLFALLVLAFGAGAADLELWQAVRDRRQVIERTLPDFLDVLAVVVSAGLSFRPALERVAEHYRGPWADELRITLRQMDLGVPRRQAFAELRRRNRSEQVDQFVTALQQGEELGAPIADTLIQIAADMRRTDAQNARRRAARTVPRATLATIAFLLPGTLILIAATFLLGAGTDLGALLGR